jgi:hypothetical protein
MREENDKKSAETMLAELRHRLIRLSGNGLANTRLRPGGSGAVINLIEEVPSLVVNRLLGGKSFTLDPLHSHGDYLADEDSPEFTGALAMRLDREGLSVDELVPEDLRAIKDEIRAELGMVPADEAIPKVNYDLDAEVDPRRDEHTDTKLQTDIPVERFDRFCKKLIKSIRDFEREKGIDCCYLTVGYLRWFVEKAGQKRFYNTPVFLIPCVLSENKNRFKIEASGKNFGVNPILSPVFRQELRAEFPQYAHSQETANGMRDYLLQVEQFIVGLNREGWSFEHRMALGPFKSTGIPVEELEPAGYTNAQLTNAHALIGMTSPDRSKMPIYSIDSQKVVADVPATAIAADESQYSAVVDTARGTSFVLEGPPGTGKSQTIVNVIADAIGRGRKVLFLAQKTVALEVVYERMKASGLDYQCFSFCGDKAKKSQTFFKRVADVVKNTGDKESAAGSADKFKASLQKFHKERDKLLQYSEFLRYPVAQTSLTAQQVIAGYIELKERALPRVKLADCRELTDAKIEEHYESSEKLDELAKEVGADLLEGSLVFKRKKCLDPFELEDYKVKLYKSNAFVQQYRTEFSYASFSEHSAELSSLREQLLLLERLAVARETWQERGIDSQIPELGTLRAWSDRLQNTLPIFYWVLPDIRRLKLEVRRIFKDPVGRWSALEAGFHAMVADLEELRNLENACANLNPRGEIMEKVERLDLAYTNAVDQLAFIENDLSVAYQDLALQDLNKLLELLHSNAFLLNPRIELNQCIEDLTVTFPDIRDIALACCRENVGLRKAVEASIYEALARSLSKEFPNYQRYRGDYLEKLRVRLDQAAEKLEGDYRQMLSDTPPNPEPKGNTATRVREKTGLTLIEHVMQTPRARLTIREFMLRAGRELNACAPCFLMTPSSVADFLPKDFQFDLLIIDEASQMLTEEATGAILRAKQVLVVGDSQQMPPSNLMASRLDAPEDDPDAKNESILDRASLCLGKKRSLLYHYRSRHESLIQFSNAEFYDNELRLIPSPQEKSDRLGVRHIEIDAIYQPGRAVHESAQPNPVEAERVVEDVCAFMLNPDNKNRSLGVAALNIRQSQRIDALLAERFEADAALSDYLDYWKDTKEYFFVKNLENVQGDERDVIFVATVFGKTAEGKVPQNFGINKSGDEKRINVLVTRAKEQLQIYSSLKPSQITTSSSGPQVLKRYLDYVANGLLPESAEKTANLKSIDTPLADWLAARMAQDSFQITRELGSSEMKIDLAVRDTNNENDYVCGVVLDGPAYYESEYTLERDCLRQKVLRSHGWNLIQVWTVDFLADPEAAYLVLKSKIDAAMAAA